MTIFRVLCLFLAFASWLGIVSDVSAQGRCRRLASTCAEGPQIRNINGYDVFKDCWRYTENWECVDQDAQDFCAPIASSPGCYQLTAACTDYAFDGSCLKQTKEWRCPDPIVPDPPNTTRLPDTLTVVRDVIDDSACRLLANQSTCGRTEGRVCIEGPATRNINGLDIFKDCWKWTERFACQGTGTVSNCGPYETNPKCTLQNESCTDLNPITNQCNMVTRYYKCEDQPPVTNTVTTCGQMQCIAGVCDNADDPGDQDFVQAVTSLEVARQGAAYMDMNSMTLFNGHDNRCSRKLYGITSCCGSKVRAGTSDAAWGVGVAFRGGEAIMKYGSMFTHDALFPSTSIMDTLFGNVGSSFGSFSFYGMSWSSTAGFAFDPTSFAISVAIAVIVQMLACNEEEQTLSLKKGQNLCHYVGTYCDQRDPFGGCITKKDSYCCYNSLLGRVIQEQGRPQLGKSWGAANRPLCGGFTVAEMSALDFSRMDLSEFFSQIQAAALNTGAINTRAQEQADRYRTAVPGSYFPPQPPIGTCVPPNC